MAVEWSIKKILGWWYLVGKDGAVSRWSSLEKAKTEYLRVVGEEFE